MIGRIDRSADFERTLQVRSRIQTAHFALHHIADQPGQTAGRRKKRDPAELSTSAASNMLAPVDDSSVQGNSPSAIGPVSSGARLWFGTVVPKRHARRSVTRSLLKRQIRAVVAAHLEGLPEGLWVVRLRSAFDPKRFGSAASAPLQRAARQELDGLFATALGQVAPR